MKHLKKFNEAKHPYDASHEITSAEFNTKYYSERIPFNDNEFKHIESICNDFNYFIEKTHNEKGKPLLITIFSTNKENNSTKSKLTIFKGVDEWYFLGIEKNNKNWNPQWRYVNWKCDQLEGLIEKIEEIITEIDYDMIENDIKDIKILLNKINKYPSDKKQEVLNYIKKELNL